MSESGAYLYILRCADGSYYVGTARGSLVGGYTALKRPVELVFQQHFMSITDAVAAERQIKGWRREKKEALIRGEFDALPALARRGRSRK